MQDQYEIDDELLNPCCAKDRQESRAAAERDRILKANDVTRIAIEARSLRPRHLVADQPDHSHCCHGDHCSAAPTEPDPIEEMPEPPDQDGSCSDASLDSIDKLLLEDEQDEQILERIAAERMGQYRADAGKAVMRVQGTGVVMLVRLYEVERMVAKYPLAVVLKVSSNDIGTDKLHNISMHLSRAAAQFIGTRFMQTEDDPTDNAAELPVGWPADGCDTWLLSLQDHKLVASIKISQLGDLGADGDALQRWLEKTGVLSSDGIHTQQDDRSDSDSDDGVVAPCGVAGCHLMFYHEHVGQGQSTGGVERFEGSTFEEPTVSHVVDDPVSDSD